MVPSSRCRGSSRRFRELRPLTERLRTPAYILRRMRGGRRHAYPPAARSCRCQKGGAYVAVGERRATQHAAEAPEARATATVARTLLPRPLWQGLHCHGAALGFDLLLLFLGRLRLRRRLFWSGRGGLVVTPRPGQLLLFAYKHANGSMDDGLTEHSGCPVDEGRTWTASPIVYREGGGSTIGDACPVQDRATGTVHLIFARNNADVYHATSSDEGATPRIAACRLPSRHLARCSEHSEHLSHTLITSVRLEPVHTPLHTSRKYPAPAFSYAEAVNER